MPRSRFRFKDTSSAWAFIVVVSDARISTLSDVPPAVAAAACRILLDEQVLPLEETHAT
jgi:hypothetical protein